MASDFARLAAAFGHVVSARTLRDVRELTACIDEVDRAIDTTPEPGDRRRIREAILASLRSGVESGMSVELAARVAALRDILRARGVVERFALVAAEALDNTERARMCRSNDEYVARTVREGQLTATMALLVAGPASLHGSFERFLLAVAEPANLVDKLVDARGDAMRGEIAIRADLRLHLRLASEVLRRVPALVRLHPRPAAMLAWGARSALGLAGTPRL